MITHYLRAKYNFSPGYNNCLLFIGTIIDQFWSGSDLQLVMDGKEVPLNEILKRI